MFNVKRSLLAVLYLLLHRLSLTIDACCTCIPETCKRAMESGRVSAAHDFLKGEMLLKISLLWDEVTIIGQTSKVANSSDSHDFLYKISGDKCQLINPVSGTYSVGLRVNASLHT